MIVSIKDFYKRGRSFSLSHFHFYNQDLGPRIKDLLSSSCKNLLTPQPATLQYSASSLPLFLLCLIFIALSTPNLQHQPFVLPNTFHQPVPTSLIFNPLPLYPLRLQASPPQLNEFLLITLHNGGPKGLVISKGVIRKAVVSKKFTSQPGGRISS